MLTESYLLVLLELKDDLHIPKMLPSYHYIWKTLLDLRQEEIWALATEERYNSYKGKSVSMIDHYYDKLSRLSTFQLEINTLMPNVLKEENH